MMTYEELGDSTLKKLESLTDNEILFILTHCSYNLLKKQNSDITDDEKNRINKTVVEMAIYFMQLTNMHNISTDELATKLKGFSKKHGTFIAKCANKAHGV